MAWRRLELEQRAGGARARTRAVGWSGVLVPGNQGSPAAPPGEPAGGGRAVAGRAAGRAAGRRVGSRPREPAGGAAKLRFTTLDAGSTASTLVRTSVLSASRFNGRLARVGRERWSSGEADLPRPRTIACPPQIGDGTKQHPTRVLSYRSTTQLSQYTTPPSTTSPSIQQTQYSISSE